ncbi:MAG: glycogen/starch synthase [Candidatus Micrarchaeia archaeon]
MSEPYLIEISSEAGRKVGGIYTVITSKSRYALKHFEKRYLYIGFYDEKCAQDVKFSQPEGELKEIFDELALQGIFCHYGEWLYAQNTPIILVDAKSFGQKNVQYDDAGQSHYDIESNHIKFLLWKHFGIDSLMEKSWDYDENVVWGWAVGMLIEKLAKISPYKEHKLIGQFHEWITGSALLYTRMRGLPIATVFTTHATVLGRSLAASGADVMALSQSSHSQIDVSKAYQLKVEGKHQLEMAAAKKCHVFGTVSETVAQEVRYILGRYPDVVMLNGMDFEHSMAEAQVRDISEYVRHEILQLSEAILTPYQSARYDNAMILFISGRYEFTNKGFDIFIDAMGKLNKRIKQKGAKKQKQVIAFIFAPSAVRGPKVSIIRNYLLLDKMNEVLDASPGANIKKHYPNVMSRINEVKTSLKRDLLTMNSSFIKENNEPPVCLFDLNYANDQIISACEKAGLRNGEHDMVKAFFYPTYLKPNDGLLNMSYDDIISGMDVGIFPSRYEPFGYTPLEAGLKFSIAVSTDSAGFGRFLLSKENLENRGVKILKMAGGADSASTQLADYLQSIYYSEPEQILEKKEDSYNLMHLFDWKMLISNYINAYDLALERAGKEDAQKPVQVHSQRSIISASKKLSNAVLESSLPLMSNANKKAGSNAKGAVHNAKEKSISHNAAARISSRAQKKSGKHLGAKTKKRK